MSSEPKRLGSILGGLVPPDVAAAAGTQAATRAEQGPSLPAAVPQAPSTGEHASTCSRCGKPLVPVRIPDPLRPGVIRAIMRARCECEDAEWEKGQSRLKTPLATPREEPDGRRADLDLGPRFTGCSFASFEPRPEAAKAFTAARRFVESFPDRLRDGYGLWFIGGCGTGKTRLAASVLNEISARFGHPVAAVAAPHFLQRLRESYRSDIPEDVEDRLLSRLQTASCLLLDDLGAETATPWGIDRIYLVLDHRNRYMLPTLVTSNFSPRELAERTDPRLVSRLMGMCKIYELGGSDYRLKEGPNGRTGAGAARF